MKTYLRTIAVIFTAFLNMNTSSAQTIQIPISDYSPIVRYFDTFLEDYYYYQPAYWHVGRYDGYEGEDTFEDTYRMYFKFNLSVIPANATVTNATLKIKIVGGECTSCEGTVVFLPYDLGAFAQERWDAIGNSETIYFENISYGELEELSSQDFTDDIISSLSESHINIGVHGPETYDLTYGIVETMDLFVDYTVPTPTYNITVENSFQGGDVIVDGQTVPSGTTFVWDENTLHTLQAFDQDWPEPNNYFRVFQDEWRKNGVSHSTNNPLTITVTENATFRAEFLSRFDFEVTHLNFLNGGSGGYINVTGQGQQSLPYDTTKLEGESIEIEVPTQIQTVNGKQVTYNFLEWSDGITDNPRTFTLTEHTQINAVMKGHLVSQSTQATALNNGRRVVQGNTPNWWFMVYEDNDQIYYTYSSDYGGTWAPEKKVSGRFSNNQHPSVCFYGSYPAKITVVWDASNGGYHYFNWRTKLLETGSWEPEYSKSDFGLFTGPASCTPVAIRGPNDIFILAKIGGFRETSVLELFQFDGDELESLGVVSGPEYKAQDPSMTRCSNIFRIVWKDAIKGWGDGIFYTQYSFSLGWGDIEEVTSQQGEIYINQQPSITHSQTSIDVVWSGFDPGLVAHVLLHRQRSDDWDGEWGEVNEVYWAYDDISHPSVGAYSYFYGGLDAVFNINNHVRSVFYDGETWGSPGFLGNGSYPSISEENEQLMTIWTDNSTELPYIIKNDLLNPDGRASRIETDYITKRFRKETFQLSHIPSPQLQGSVSLKVGDIRLESVNGISTLSFTHKNDSLNPKPFLQTEAFAITPEVQSLIIDYRVDVNDLQKPKVKLNLPLFGLRLLDANSGTPLLTLKQAQFDTLHRPNYHFADSLIVDLQPYVGRQAVLQMRGIYHLIPNVSKKAERLDIFEFYEAPTSKQVIALNQIENGNSTELPTVFHLSQNYPNPFNPTTTIAFDLPQNSFAELEIYDISGKKVRTVVNKNMEAGSHQVVWNGLDDLGNQVASGVYFYRIQAGEFIAVNKMMLLR